MAALDWSQCPAVESIPGKVSGAWVLKGTRMPVSIILWKSESRRQHWRHYGVVRRSGPRTSRSRHRVCRPQPWHRSIFACYPL